jgi:UDPglucose 6-dehydrogenase
MTIGIVGYGVVGRAIAYGFMKLGYEVIIYDILMPDTKIEDMKMCDIVFVCVPTPMKGDGSCDTSIVCDVVEKLDEVMRIYDGIIAIKSTVPPGTTSKLQEGRSHEVCFVPEFLRERHALSDFMENHNICVIGSDNEKTYQIIKDIHGHLPKKFIQLSPTEAEIVKYAHNAFNALRVVFANNIFEICESTGSYYDAVKASLLCSTGIPDQYLDVNANLRGYVSPCLDKDVPALIHFMDHIGLGSLTLFKSIVSDNNQFEKTPMPGTRS